MTVHRVHKKRRV